MITHPAAAFVGLKSLVECRASGHAATLERLEQLCRIKQLMAAATAKRGMAAEVYFETKRANCRTPRGRKTIHHASLSDFPPVEAPTFAARLIGPSLSERFSEQFMVEDRPAPAAISPPRSRECAHDGYTLLLAALPNASNATLYENLKFNCARHGRFDDRGAR